MTFGLSKADNYILKVDLSLNKNNMEKSKNFIFKCSGKLFTPNILADWVQTTLRKLEQPWIMVTGNG